MTCCLQRYVATWKLDEVLKFYIKRFWLMLHP